MYRKVSLIPYKIIKDDSNNSYVHLKTWSEQQCFYRHGNCFIFSMNPMLARNKILKRLKNISMFLKKTSLLKVLKTCGFKVLVAEEEAIRRYVWIQQTALCELSTTWVKYIILSVLLSVLKFFFFRIVLQSHSRNHIMDYFKFLRPTDYYI